MKIVLAPDKFKGTLRSPQVCAILKKAFQEVLPDTEILSLPMADGGEGTVDAIVSATKGELRMVRVTGPLGKTVDAEFGLFNNGRSAVMEMASASGMALVNRNELDPMIATSFGTGELLRAILDAGAKEIIIGIGGSATVDGGAGMAQALGFRLLDKNAKELPAGAAALEFLDDIDTSGADHRLREVSVRIACDVTNPLLGSNGAAKVYAPQKGATPEMVVQLEKNLENLACVWKKTGMLDSVENPGDGAAGGMGAGLRAFCNATSESGARLIMHLLHFKENLKNCSFVITGEGCTDDQTEAGKLCSELAATAREVNVPVLLISGGLKGDLSLFHKNFDLAFSTSTGRLSLEETLAHSAEDLRFTALNLAKLIKRIRP